MATEEYRPEGRYITALDVADRLMPDLAIHEVLLWPPDLFAYTSYVLTMTSAYQLVVSPPPRKRWQPDVDDVAGWLLVDLEANLEAWLGSMREHWLEKRESARPKKLSATREIRQAIEVRAQEIAVEVRAAFREVEREIAHARKEAKAKKVPSEEAFWQVLVQESGEKWQENLWDLSAAECNLIDDTVNVGKTKEQLSRRRLATEKARREKKLYDIVMKRTPPLLMACWAFFHRFAVTEKFEHGYPLRITELLCNQEHHRHDPEYTSKVWNLAQAILTMHAIADIASVSFGVSNDSTQFPPKLRQEGIKNQALEFADRLLFGRYKGLYQDTLFFGGGSLSTFNTERVRILPKRHNPGVGITLRSISSNLAFHQSSVDVVWRKAINNRLSDRLTTDADNHPEEQLAILLLPFPETVRSNEFGSPSRGRSSWLRVSEKARLHGHRYFSYYPRKGFDTRKLRKIVKLIANATRECGRELDIVVLPEASLTTDEYNSLVHALKDSKKPPNILIAGVIESKVAIAKLLNVDSEEIYFPRNAVYCNYFDKDANEYHSKHKSSFTNNAPPNSTLGDKLVTEKFKQYKHHRWQLDKSQISRYGLTTRLDPKRLWWEAIKVSRRRVSFLNVGNRLTISHLICEDLARQDPISDLIRHVGPSLVVAILMDGPQLKNRWSARYATVLADDPGSSVLTLTSFGMVRRDASPHGPLSRVIGLWNDSNSRNSREIELATGARAVLLSLRLEQAREKTADGRQEKWKTSVAVLEYISQIYEDH